ncbi:MAG: DUF2480 family protein [Cryomorphaceae bacterium]|nr:DUF2480 family protein [Cryomorphaceae bacterium]
MEEDIIVNRVAQSKLITLDVDALLPRSEVVHIDILDFSDGGLLREKVFREKVKNYAWENHRSKWVNLWCSEDMIIPLWAYMILSAQVSSVGAGLVCAAPDKAESEIIKAQIHQLDFSEFKDKPVVLKGCNRPDVGEEAYALLAAKLTPVVRSLMFGEACSSVPVYKKAKK